MCRRILLATVRISFNSMNTDLLLAFGNLFLELTFRTNQNIRFETFPLISIIFLFRENYT